MAISVYFNNKKITLPGAYATIAAGEQNDPRALDYGKCLIIDTGVLGAKWGGGAGINGKNANGKNAIYRFDNIEDFRSFVKGGWYWQLANALFFPDASNPAAVGISELMFVRAASTTPATMTFTATGGGSNGGVFKIITLDEGLNANGLNSAGEAATDELTTGYAFSIVSGTLDPLKYVFQIWRGTFTGLAPDGVPFNEVPAASAAPRLIIESPEFNNMNELISWARSSSAFNQLFMLDSSSAPTGTGEINKQDITVLTKYSAATGGGETYNSEYFDNVLSAIVNLDESFVFTDQYGTQNYNSAMNKALIAHVNNVAKFKKQVFIGVGEDQGDFSTSLEAAQGFDSSHVCVVHGGVGMPSTALGIGYRWWGVMYNLCSIIGRTAGKAPQIPVTNKSIGVSKLKHQLTETDKKKALDAGVLVTVYNESLQKFVVLQGINTLQDNQVLFTGNGESFSIQFMRIVDQINKELIVNSEIDLLGAENGVNANTLSVGILKNWTENYLLTRTANSNTDNLILSYRNVTVTKKDDYYWVTYGIVINNEINKIFFTGFVFKN
jgi:hypothetical protein